jgi:hypothetical protein
MDLRCMISGILEFYIVRVILSSELKRRIYLKFEIIRQLHLIKSDIIHRTSIQIILFSSLEGGSHYVAVELRL